MNILLFAALILYFAATVLQFTAAAMKKPALHTAARLVLLAGFAAHTAFTVWRGIAAGRLPLANQFEFASGFAWAAVVLGFLLRHRLGQEGILTAAAPAAFLILSYAAFQPRDIKELMPALRSTWFALHIGSAAFSYAAFAIAGGLGVSYAIYLHQRLRLKWQGKRMAILAIVALVLVLFTFAGVNLLLPGLHSYASAG